jgi:hypothetical protein
MSGFKKDKVLVWATESAWYRKSAVKGVANKWEFALG